MAFFDLRGLSANVMTLALLFSTEVPQQIQEIPKHFQVHVFFETLSRTNRKRLKDALQTF